MRPAHAADTRIGAGPGRRRRRERYGGLRGLHFSFDLGSLGGRGLALFRFFLLLLAPGVGALVRLALALPFCLGFGLRLPVACQTRPWLSPLPAPSGRLSRLACCAFLASGASCPLQPLASSDSSLCLGDLFVRLGAREGALALASWTRLFSATFAARARV